MPRRNDGNAQSNGEGRLAEAQGLNPSAKILGVSPHTLRLYARQRRIAHVRIGRRLLFMPEDLQEFLRQHRVEAR